MPADNSPTLLTAKDLVVRFNDRTILDHATLSIHEGERIGLVGRNGTGKSTFLKLLAGEATADSGDVMGKRDLLVGYLSQDFTLDPALNVMENIRVGAKHVLDAITEFEALPWDSHQHEELEHYIQLHDGWNLDTRIATAMSKLGCPPAEGSIVNLSGGEKRRVALCRAIISQPDLLILDEPTNHLDAESIEWLGEFLKSFPGAMLLVTHDRYFLDEITQTIVELANGTFFSYEGNYTDYLVGRAEREASAEVVEHKRQMFLRRELEWVRRGPKAQTSKSKARLDQFFEIQGQKVVEADGDVDLVIPPPPPLGNRVVELTNLGMELGGRQLFSGLNLTFEGGTRIGITGRNGLGKTTLLKIILGQLEPTEGTVKTGQLVKFNYVDQSRLQLNEDKTVFDEVSDGTEYVIWGNDRLSLRGYLKRFLFTDERISTQVKYLSGGERSRLLLARILKNGGNFLILDEPTNDLDLQTLRVLEEALVTFPGVVVVVSHDRYFLNRVCTGIVAFEGDGRVTCSVGDYDYYLEKRKRAAVEAAKAQAPATKAKPAAATKPSANKPRKLSFKEQQELAGMESRIQSAEKNIERIEGLFADPEFHRKQAQQAAGLNVELEQTKMLVADLYARWEELEAVRAAAEKPAAG
jgi:ABC transport system ATP-binding/permease protein